MESETHKIDWLEFDLLMEHPDVAARVFLRHGGTSQGPFCAFNASNKVGDNPDCVKSNRKLMKELMGLDKIVFADQTHGIEMRKVTSKDEDTPVCDILFTTEKNLGLAITHADCQAAVIYDPDKQVLAVVHAGWRGLVQKIYQRCVEGLGQEQGCSPEQLIVCISPSLCPDHSEFKNYKQEMPEEYWSFQTKPNYFDLWAIAKKELTEAGVKEENIEIAEICTACRPKEYFSYRREKKTGRHATIAALRP